MIVYDQSINCFNYYENDAWTGCLTLIAASNAVLANLSGTTTIADLNTILPALTGVLSDKEASYQNYIVGNPGAFSSPATQAEVQAMVNAISATDVVGPSGNIWMDRNLGASQVATSSTDAAAYGDLYQWGRGADGHEARNSSTTTTSSTGDAPGHGNFIVGGNDWRTSRNNNLWQGINGTNNPCPTGYRVPTEAELSGLGITNAATAFSSPLKLTLTGHRNYSSALLVQVATDGYYWTSTVSSGSNARRIRFYSSTAHFNDLRRAYGFAVRCIKD